MLKFGLMSILTRDELLLLHTMALICTVTVREQHFSSREIFPQSTVVSMDFILVKVHGCSGRASKITLLTGDFEK